MLVSSRTRESHVLGSMSASRVQWVVFFLLVRQCSAQGVVCKPSSAGRLGDNLRVYNSTLFPANLFRNETDRMYFKKWPEDFAHPRFRFHCQDASSMYSLSNFTVNCDQMFGRLDPRPYYDVGIADGLQPFYKHWRYSEIPTLEIQLWCERTDMHRLYAHRIVHEMLLPAVLSGIVLVIIVEVAVVSVLCMSARRRALLKKRVQSFRQERMALKLLSTYLGGSDVIADCLHILLLVMAGFCMIEGVSHSSSMSWRSICMLDAAVVYSYLTLFAVLSTIARQVATACREAARDKQIDADKYDVEMQSAINERDKPMASENDDEGQAPRPMRRVTPRSLSTTPQGRRGVVGVDDDDDEDEYGKDGNDWRWQRVFNQCGVVVLMTAFLTHNENFAGTALDSLVSVVWSVIMVAATWSIGVSIVVGARSLTFLASYAAGRTQWPRHRATAP